MNKTHRRKTKVEQNRKFKNPEVKVRMKIQTKKMFISNYIKSNSKFDNLAQYTLILITWAYLTLTKYNCHFNYR